MKYGIIINSIINHDKKFVFVNSDLATDEYRLVYSNVNGEVTNLNGVIELDKIIFLLLEMILIIIILTLDNLCKIFCNLLFNHHTNINYYLINYLYM